MVCHVAWVMSIQHEVYHSTWGNNCKPSNRKNWCDYIIHEIHIYSIKGDAAAFGWSKQSTERQHFGVQKYCSAFLPAVCLFWKDAWTLIQPSSLNCAKTTIRKNTEQEYMQCCRGIHMRVKSIHFMRQPLIIFKLRPPGIIFCSLGRLCNML